MHLKRQKVPKNWPIFRKGTKYIARPNMGDEKSVPLLVVLRDILKVAKNKKEVKRAIYMKHVLVNNKPVRDERKGILLFDTITLVPMKKNYRFELSEKGKFIVNEIKENEANYKISKIIDKKILKGRKTQLNLSGGRNFLSETKCNVSDSVLINLKEKKIEKIIPFKEGSKVVVFAGKHAGKRGKISKIDSENKRIELNVSNGEKINVLIKQVIVAE